MSAISSAMAFSEEGSVPAFRRLGLTSSSTLPTRLGVNIRVSLGERSGLEDWKLQANAAADLETFNPRIPVGGSQLEWGLLTDASRNQPASGTDPGRDAASSPWSGKEQSALLLPACASVTNISQTWAQRTCVLNTEGQSSFYDLETAYNWEKQFGCL